MNPLNSNIQEESATSLSQNDYFANYREIQPFKYSPAKSDQQPIVINQELVESQQVGTLDNPAFDLIGLSKLRSDPQFAGIDGSGLSVAVIDTGVDLTHPLIAPNYLTGYDFVDNDYDPTDPDGHGTHVAGIIGAVNQNIGVAPDVGLISLRALDNNNQNFFTKLEESLEWVLANKEKYNITAVNLSFGVGSFTPESLLIGDIVSDDIKRLEDAGVTVIAAAGNSYFANSEKSNLANLAFPAVTSTLAVGAVWRDGVESNAVWRSGSIDYTTGADRIASFSQRLNAPNFLFAPGAVITSTQLGGGISRRGGTSQATPHVAGAVALLQEASLQFSNRLLTTEEVKEILRTTGESVVDGDDEDDNVSHTNDTYIRINLYNAVAEVKRRSGLTVAPPPATEPALLSEDVNGAISRAMRGPILDSSVIRPIRESIGFDGITPLNNDVDVYSFQVVSPGSIKIELSSDLLKPHDFDSYLRLFDSSGKQLAVNDNIALDNTFSQLEVTLTPDTYYVGVSGSNNIKYDPNVAGSGIAGDTGNYTLELSYTNSNSNDLLIDVADLNSDHTIDTEDQVHRFFNLDTGLHFYTASATEQELVSDSWDNYRYEGAFFSEGTATAPGAKPVYRFLNVNTGGHLYTLSEVERDLVRDRLSNYNYEGIAFYGYASDHPGTTPLYRFYNSVADAHFYTPSIAERDAVLANLPDYQLESHNGIAFYVESLTVS